MNARLWFLLVPWLAAIGCDGGEASVPDIGALEDTGGATDLGSLDGAVTDSGVADLGPVDSGGADRDSSSEDGGGPQGVHWPPRIDPSTFDCRAVGLEPPPRRSPVPSGCVIDPGCHDRMVVGHRGLGGDFGYLAPENSLSAIRGAIALGLDGVEVDVRLTSDGHLVIMHDSTVDRTTDGTGEVSEMTLDELRALHLKVHHGDMAPIGDFSCETVPLLSEVVELARGRLFLDLDVKTSRADLVAQAIRDLGAQDFAFISASGFDKPTRAREAVPGVRLQVRPDSPGEVDGFLARFDPIPDIFEMDDGEVAPVAARLHELGAKVFVDAFYRDPGALVGKDVSVYQGLWDDGSDIIQTEFPVLVLVALGRFDPATGWNPRR